MWFDLHLEKSQSLTLLTAWGGGLEAVWNKGVGQEGTSNWKEKGGEEEDILNFKL